MVTLRKKEGPVTLKAIAALAGCSVSCVSTVLNKAHGNTLVSDSTRDRILKIAEEQGYRPDFASRSLKRRCTKTIGIYVQPGLWRSLSNSYESEIFRGVECGARALGYDVMVLNMSTDLQPEICGLRLQEKRVDGVILIHVDRPFAEALASDNTNIVAVDCAFGSPNVSRIDFDNAAALDLAVGHLQSIGHTKIGFVGNCTAEEEAPRERYFLEAMKHYQVKVPDQWVFNQAKCFPPVSPNEQFCQREGEWAAHYFASLAEKPTAIVIYNSLAAAAFLSEAAKLGVRIPGDFSIISIDDHEFLQFLQPHLTVVDHMLADMGECGSRLLIDLIEGRCEGPVQQTIAPRLRIHESCLAMGKERRLKPASPV